MKKLLYSLFAILAIAACSDSDINNGGDPTPPKQPQITLDATAANFTTDGGSNTITFSSSDAWTAQIVNSRADGWCSIEPTSGPAGNANIKVTTTPNETHDNRTASIIIKAGTVSKTINVSQKQKDALTVTSPKFEVSAKGGEVSIEVKANIDFEYAIEDSATDWVEYKATRALKTSNLVFEVKENEQTEKREANIIISSGNFTETVTIYQAGAEPTIILTENEVAVSSSANTIAIEVKSNVDVEIEMPNDADWISENTTRALSTNTYYFDIEQNDGYDNRTAQIKFVNKENNIYEHVTITQMQRDAIVVAEAEYEFGVDGGELEFDIQTNVDIKVTISNNAINWIQMVNTRGLETKTLNFLIAACAADESREGTITISGGNTSQDIKVKQSAYKAEVDPESVPDDEIWYITSDNKVYDIYQGAELYGLSQPFDRKVVSNTYKNGLGVIKFDGPVTIINNFTFYINGYRITDIYLPDTIEFLGTGAIYETKITSIRIPKNLKRIDSYGLENPELTTFTGHNISEDGKCVIIDGTLFAFADKGVVNYSLPSDVKSIEMFTIFKSLELENLELNEGLEHIGKQAISDCPKLKSITFPNSLKSANESNFYNCDNMVAFYGNEEFCTPDNKCFKAYLTHSHMPIEWHGYWLIKFAGTGATEYTIPEGIKAIDNYAFCSTDLRSVTLAESLVHVGAEAFSKCQNLEALYGAHTSSDHRSIVFNGELSRLVVNKGIPTDYRIPDDITSIGYSAFENNNKIVNITMGDQITRIGGYAFANCQNLKSITLSSGLSKISAANGGYNPFLRSDNLEAIYFRSYLPPIYLDSQMSDFPKLKVYVPKQSYELYKKDSGWNEFRKYMVAYDCEDIIMPNFYVSTDFSKDGEVTLLQKASEGRGIDLVMMGDIYSDRQIESGLYRQDMELAVDAFFNIEPYKSFRHLFNVYMVTAVSAVENMGQGSTAFATNYAGVAVGGYDPLAIEYTLKAVGEERMDDAMAVVLVNDSGYGGTCYFNIPESSNNDWGSGFSLSYFSVNDRKEALAELIQHETGGHGFVKLSDEYSYEYMGHVSAMDIVKHTEEYEKYGWWKNTDFTSDPTKVKWSHFLTDSRYKNEDLGVFEGGLVYPYGVWRPSQNSIMNTDTDGFNAPSREAIYYRINKLAYGADWKYDYEEFAKWDEKNRKKEENSSIPYRMNSPKSHQLSRPPVVINKSWRNIK